MRRRESVRGLAGAVGIPFAARAQQLPIIASLGGAHLIAYGRLVNAFQEGLQQSGMIKGRDFSVEFQWADGKIEALPGLARRLVSRGVAIIVTTGGTVPALAAKNVTAEIPVLFVSGSDPIKAGLIKHFNQPEGNLTGVHQFSAVLSPKRISLLQEINPGAAVIGFLVQEGNNNG